MPLLDLPLDIQLALCLQLSPLDILALKQTCRGLHTLGCMDYVWHRLRVDLPLDLPLNKATENLKSSELQPIVIKALRLEQNWKGNPGHPRKLDRIQHDGIIIQIRILGPQWLLTSSRHLGGSQLSLWCLKSGARHRICEAQGSTKFSVALQSESKGILSVIGGYGSRKECLDIYSFALPHNEDGECAVHLDQRIPKPANGSTFFDAQFCEDVVAAAIARFSDSTSPSYEFLFINTSTKNQRLFHPHLPQGIDPLRFELLPGRIILIGTRFRKTLVIYVYDFRSTSYPVHLSSGDWIVEKESVGALTLQHEFQFPAGFHYHISEGPTTGSPDSDHLSVLVFPPLDYASAGCVLTIPLGPERNGGKLRRIEFRMSRGLTAEHVRMGSTGRRAVWLQRRWDTDEFELVKASFPSSGTVPKVDLLLPKHLALPFETHTCCALAFDERIGRVCVGLHTGDVYVLDF